MVMLCSAAYGCAFREVCLLDGVRLQLLGRASLVLLQCSANAVKSLRARRVCTDARMRVFPEAMLTLGGT